jgi:hypothetical protein
MAREGHSCPTGSGALFECRLRPFPFRRGLHAGILLLACLNKSVFEQLGGAFQLIHVRGFSWL